MTFTATEIDVLLEAAAYYRSNKLLTVTESGDLRKAAQKLEYMLDLMLLEERLVDE